MNTCTLTHHNAITAAWPLAFWIIHEAFWGVRKLLKTLTISIFINQLKYPVNHLIWRQQIAVFIQLSMAGFLQSINRLRVTGKYVTLTLTKFHYNPMIYLQVFFQMCCKMCKSFRYIDCNCITSTISRSSVLSMYPLPSLSYILKVHLSLCSNLPLRTKFKAATYSRKSMVLSCVHEERESKKCNHLECKMFQDFERQNICTAIFWKGYSPLIRSNDAKYVGLQLMIIWLDYFFSIV